MKKVLIVEDDPQLHSVYQSLLSKEGYEVVLAGTGTDGLTAVRTQHPDLVMLDIMLAGGLNGFDVLEQVKRLPETKDIPVIMLSNLDREEQVAKSIGAAHFFVKVNTSNDAILGKVRELIGA